jgi:large subunit ribosomal protein L24e
MNCTFCGKNIPIGNEKIFVDKKGKAMYFCSRKCELNFLKLKRKPRKVRWTEAYRKEKAIRLKGLKTHEKEVKEKEQKKTAEKKEKEGKKVTKEKREGKKKKENKTKIKR